ncbi:MAG TPA: Asp-tRNA(Asn)/Glu-tRNA(Gln) amidotransferase subunit GatB, partial [Candidatus Paceibacterota bacterium]
MEYRPTIGLEVHAELKTRTKMFCDSKNDPDEKEPNVNICPICMGHPGTLPTINKMAVKHVLKVGIAVGGELADFTEFDRKNYFYPDLPKGYQISQYKYPLVKGGELGGVKLTRIHLEEDTARSLHEEGDFSLIDYNRAGVPLMELVTEPVIKSAEEAGHFARELQLLLRTLQAGEANMEKGEMRVEANISVSADEKLGTKVEVKNLNSFRSVESAIHYEIQRHAALLERGEKIVQETRGWDEEKQETYSQRLKEESHDYRYFPEPDLPKLYIREIPEFAQDKLKKEIPELPEETRKRYQLSFGLKKEDTEVLLTNEPLRTLFEGTASRFKDDPPAIQLAANYLTSDLVGLIRGKDEEGGSPSNITKDSFIKLIGMTRSGKITSRIAKNILLELFNKGGDPESIANRDNLFKKSGEPELKSLAETIITDYPKAVNEYRNGK